MNLVMFVLFMLFVSGIKFAGSNQFFEDYCSAKKSDAIKGIFVILIFLSHGMDYFDLTEADYLVKDMSEFLKQHIVVPFLFFSGFGLMESIQKKGLTYVKKIPINRALRTLVFADVAVLTFAAYFIVSGRTLTLKNVFLSLIFWEELGNSTWYFFVIIALYLITYLSFRIFHKNYYIAAAATVIISAFLFFFLIRTKDIFWYNTFFVYHFGMWYSLLRKKIDPIVMKNDFLYCAAMLLSFLGFYFFRQLGSFYYFIICGCFGMTFVVVLMMKVSLDNPFLQFLGTHVLGFYAFHRLPMIVIAPADWKNAYNFIFCFIVTSLLVLAHEWFIKWMDKKIFLRWR